MVQLGFFVPIIAFLDDHRAETLEGGERFPGPPDMDEEAGGFRDERAQRNQQQS